MPDDADRMEADVIVLLDFLREVPDVVGQIEFSGQSDISIKIPLSVQDGINIVKHV